MRTIKYTATLVGVICLHFLSSAGIERPAPPFRILFNNDLTNVVNCESPFHSIGEPFTKHTLQASINETCDTGIDVHALSPGHGWEPLWVSDIYPYREHARWYRNRTGMEVSTFGDYMLAGDDVVGDFVEHCRKVNMPAFISFRLNDWHHKNYVDLSREQLEEFGIKDLTSMEISRFYDEHPEYRLGNIRKLPVPDPETHQEYLEKYRNEIKANNLQDWSIPAVRQHKFAFIEEICRNYDIDGLELDFLRHGFYFKPEFPLETRADIMTTFVEKVRALLDETKPSGKYRWLCVRMPTRLDDLKWMGLDLRRLRQTGVDMFNLSYSYETEQQNDLARICEMIPGAAVYLEVTHVITRYHGNDKPDTRHYNRNEDLNFILTKPEHYFTSAHLAYSRGAKGISLFNFAYYRQHKGGHGRAFREPFFEIFRIISDPVLVASQPQHYFIGDYDYNYEKFSGADLANGLKKTFTLDMAPPEGGWRNDARLRIQVEPAWRNGPCGIVFNSQILEATDNIAEPYETDLIEGLGDEESLRAWVIPKEILINGLNSLEVNIPKGMDSRLVLLDIAVR